MKLLDNTIDRDTFKRMHSNLQEQIDKLDMEIIKMEHTRNTDFGAIEEILAMTRNVYKTYMDSPTDLQRKYLRFFFDKIYAEDGLVVGVEANPLFESLKRINQEVILTSHWLEKWSQFRTTDWINYLEYPEYTTKEINRFLNV